MHNAKPGRVRAGAYCVYVRTRTRPGDKVRREKIPAAYPTGRAPAIRQGRACPYRGNHTNLRISPMTSMATLNNCPMVKTPRM